MAFLCEVIEVAEEELLLTVESGPAVLTALAHVKLSMHQKVTAYFVAELVSSLSKCIYVPRNVGNLEIACQSQDCAMRIADSDWIARGL